MNLRPYQQQLVTEIRGQYQLGHRSVLAVLPTGGGKTYIFSHIAQAAARKGNRVCILVHRAELLDQATRSLSGMDVPHGIIAANRGMDLSHAVQVASVQTVARRLHLLPRDFFQLAIIDECHHSMAKQWSACIAHFAAAKLLGVTATPIRSDGRGLGGHYQVMVEGPTAAELTSEGYLAPAKVLAPPGFDSAGLRKRMGDFDAKDAEQRVGTIMGDCVGHYRKHLDGQTAIAFCCSVAHAEATARLFQSAGIAAASIDGTMSGERRRDLLSELGTGRLRVLTSCALIGEGVDVPSVGGCILLRPTASVGLHLQMIGRCLRPQDGKRAVVLDHVGNTLRLGHHLEPREWSLDGGAKQTREQAPSVKVCPQCFATSPSQTQVCSDCGHEFRAEVRELKVVEGELVEIQRETFRVGDLVKVNATGNQYVIGNISNWNTNTGKGLYFQWKDAGLFDALGAGPPDALGALAADCIFVSRPNLKREQGKATDLQSLRELAKQRGYKNPTAWAKHLLAARQTRNQWSKTK
jgi:DNA repair protein RadD